VYATDASELLGACLRVSLSSSMRYAPASVLSLA
jgi:hypothetical protein